MAITKTDKSKDLFLKFGLFAVALAGIAGILYLTQLFALSPVAHTSLSSTSLYRGLRLTWDAVPNAEFYAVYRSEDASGTNAARIAVVDGSDSSYDDRFLIPGSTHTYIVMYGDLLATLNNQDPAKLDWAGAELRKTPSTGPLDENGDIVASPHTGETNTNADSKTCHTCHQTHDAANIKLLTSSGNSNHENLVNALCADCHEDDTAIEKDFVTGLSTAGKSGHSVMARADGRTPLECATCHNSHADSAADGDSFLLPEYVKAFGDLDPVADKELLKVDPNDLAPLCVTCHDDEQTWYNAMNDDPYPDSKTPIKADPNDPNTPAGYGNYVIRGTFPGKTIAQDPAKNGHARIIASPGRDAGGCMYCHSSHASDAPYSGIMTERGEYRSMIGADNSVEIESERISGDYASLCLSCHNNSHEKTPWQSAVDIASLVSLPNGSTEADKTAFLASNAGHKIQSSGSTIPTGSNIPCYICHSPHGSRYGNTKNINDELVQGISTAGLARDFCFTCHVSNDGKVLKTDASGYMNLSDVTTGPDQPRTTILGLSRAAGTTKLTLPSGIVAARHMSTDTEPCYSCHGNTHNPMVPDHGDQTEVTSSSLDGNECLECHSTQYPNAVGVTFYPDGHETWNYEANPHMWSAYSNRVGVYFRPESILLNYTIPHVSAPTETSLGLYCVSCHPWHSSDIGVDQSQNAAGYLSNATLRAGYNSYQTANSDFVYNPNSTDAQTGGLCLSCHNNDLGSSSIGAPTVGPLNDRNLLKANTYSQSGHNYDVTINRAAHDDTGSSSTFTKTFNANCVKCHNYAEPNADPKANRNDLVLNNHHVAGQRELAPIGLTSDLVDISTSPDPAIERAQNFNRKGMCFGCHARVGEITGNAGKKYAGEDFYGVEAINNNKKILFKNAGGTTIGTQTLNSEAVLDDMYKLPAGGFSHSESKANLHAAQENSGHQPTDLLNIDRAPSHDGSATDQYALNNHVRWNMTSIRCSECHNVHTTQMNSMGTYTSWSFTKKPIAPTDKTTPASAIAADGTRLVTLNDYYYRYDMLTGAQWNFKNRFIQWLQNARELSAQDAEVVFAEMQYNGITADDLRMVNAEMQEAAGWQPFSAAEIASWEQSVDIFCFRCHSNVTMSRAAHAKAGHKSVGIACVNCHVPQVHGGKMKNLLGDRGAIPGIDGRSAGQVVAGHGTLPEHQIVRWTAYSHKLTKAQNEAAVQSYNQPTLKLQSSSVVYTDANWQSNKNQCSTAPGCHTTAPVADTVGTTDSMGRTHEHWVGNN